MDIDHKQLLALVPHRPPILMLDKVVDIVPGERGSGVRSFQEDDPCFSGHFPGNAILPGVLTVEACAQTALVVSLSDKARGEVDASSGRLAKCREFAFLAPIVPGVEVQFSVEIERRVGDFLFVDCTCTAENEIVAKGKLTLKI